MHANGSFWDVLLDSLIAGALAALGPLAAAFVTSQAYPTGTLLYGAFLAFGGAFLLSLQLARGRKHEPDVG